MTKAVTNITQYLHHPITALPESKMKHVIIYMCVAYNRQIKVFNKLMKEVILYVQRKAIQITDTKTYCLCRGVAMLFRMVRRN